MGANKEVIEVLSPFGNGEPIHRMKICGLVSNLEDIFDFREFDSSSEKPVGLLINCLHQDVIGDPNFIKVLSERAKYSVVMLMLADFYPTSIEYLQKWSEFVDIFLVPTPEMQKFIQIYTHKKVEVLIDPIDFGLMASEKKRSDITRGMRVVWFGYPESYGKSMSLFEGRLIEMHRTGEIQFHIISKNDSYGESPTGFMHEYTPETFPGLISHFDVCVLSHMPFDFSISTQWKSENKAVLAINRGLPVIASNTPAYQRLLKACNQEEFLFSTKDELSTGLRKLMDPQERARYLDASQDIILKRYSAKRMSEDWLEIFLSAKLLKKSNQ